MQKNEPVSDDRSRSRSGAFTLIELMVVVGIIVVLATISIPAVKVLSKGNAQAQALNMIRAELASARSIAIAQHREAGVVFFDESSAFSSPVNAHQTAMQIFVEDFNQSAYGTTSGTVYIAYNSERQYLPAGIMVGALAGAVAGAGETEDIRTGDNTGTGVGAISRCVVFSGDGNVVFESHMATPLTTANYNAAKTGQYPTAYGDWRFTNPSSTRVVNLTPPYYIPGNANATLALVVFSQQDYLQQNFPVSVAGTALRTTWLEQNADIVVINSYTGNPIK